MVSTVFRGARLHALCLTGLASASMTVWAQDAALQSVVVTANGQQQQVKDAAASISVITREDLQKQPVTSVYEAIGRLEGVSIVGGSPNEQEISIRGMPGEYTLLMVDGIRQNTRETMNRGTGGVQLQLLPPLEAIERIEVVRGPMGSMYGGDALGGVVNVITRKVPAKWMGSVQVSTTLQKHADMGDSKQLDFWVGGPAKADVLGVQLFGQYRTRDEDDIYYPAPFTSGANGQRDRSIGAKISLKPTTNQDLTLALGTEEFGYQRSAGKTLADNAASTRTDYGRTHAALTHEGRWSFGKSTVSLSTERGTQDDTTNGVRSAISPEVTNTLLDGQLALPFTRHLLRLGAQYQNAKVTGIAGQDPIPGFPARNVDSVTWNSWALSAEDDFFLTEQFTLTGGARLDHHEVFGSHVSPRLYGVYQLSPAWTLRGGVASGFKAPTIRQSVAGYCMTTGGNTPLRGNLCGNPDLKPETSVSHELGASYEWAPRSSVTATAFYSRFKNKVASYDTGVPDPRLPARTIYVYDNIDRVNIHGLEFSVKAPLMPSLAFNGSYTYTKSKRKGGGELNYDGSSLNGEPFDKAPEHMLKTQLDWQPMDKLNAYLRANYYGKSYWAAFRNGATNVRERPGSTTLDLGGSYAFTPNLTLKLAVLNLTDKLVPVDARGRTAGLDGNWTQDEGRRFWLALNATF